jgi:UDP-N-acetylmuramate--alanine ligase
VPEAEIPSRLATRAEDAGVRVPDGFRGIESIHLIGIGGTAMTPLATISLQMGISVSGSDVSEPPWLEALQRLGATVQRGHRAEHVGAVDLVVTSSAVPADNVEVQRARQRGIPVVKHSAALGALMRARRGIGVAGTHGKTTTTALLSVVLDSAGMDPTFHVGSQLRNYGLFGRYGRGELLVAEADEFDRRFLDYEPELALITSVEPDHLDYFGAFDRVVEAFQAFVGRIRPGGALLVCADDPVAAGLAPRSSTRISYGWTDAADWRLLRWAPTGREGSEFTLRAPGGEIRELFVPLLGRHNASNAAGVVAAAAHLGLSREAIARGLASFRGTSRRFEVIAEVGGTVVVDDYAHHPTAIRVTLEAARLHYGCPIWVIFQPHTAHRTESLFADFVTCFAEADHVILAPTYRPAGREFDADDPSVRALVAAMRHPDVRYAPAGEAADIAISEAQPGDLVMVMGAGDINAIEPRLIAGLRNRRARA